MRPFCRVNGSVMRGWPTTMQGTSASNLYRRAARRADSLMRMAPDFSN